MALPDEEGTLRERLRSPIRGALAAAGTPLVWLDRDTDEALDDVLDALGLEQVGWEWTDHEHPSVITKRRPEGSHSQSSRPIYAMGQFGRGDGSDG